MAASLTYRLIAPDAARPDLARISSALRQIQGCAVDLEVRLEPLAHEIRFSVEGHHPARVCAVIEHLYPGAQLERVAETGQDQPPASATAHLCLAQPLPYPLKIWETFAGQDPVAALAGAARQLQTGECLESRLTLWPQPVDWRPPSPSAPHLTPLVRMLNASSALGLTLFGALGYVFLACVLYGNLFLQLLGVAGVATIALVFWARYQNYRWLYAMPGDARGQAKGYDTLFAVSLTLTAKAGTPDRALQLLEEWQSYYQVFDAGGGGNRWVATAEHGLRHWLERRRPIYLTAAEIAGHWHLPVDALQSPFTARQGHRPLMPPPLLLDAVHLPPGNFPLGHYRDGVQARAVHVPLDMLSRHTLVLGETQSGKSRLVERLCEGLLVNPDQSLVVIDPHSSLVRRLAGKLPVDQQQTAVVWDLGRTDQPVPLNLLAAPGGVAEANVIADQIVEMLRGLWADSWGPRLEYHLGYCLRTLLAARLPELLTHPGFHPFTLLDVQSLITDAEFRSAALNTLNDPDLKRYWQAEFRPLLEQPHLFQEVFMPILNKVGAYVQREPARHIVGQFTFTPLLENALTRPGCVLVDLAPSIIGNDTARLVASTLLLTLRNLVSQRQHQPPDRWVPITVVVDELQWLNPGSLDRWMAELTKLRVNLIVITQSLELLDAADPHLRAQMLANVSNLFAFALMADDAGRIAPQFDGQVGVNDLLNLPPRQCYAKVAAGGQRQPVFSLEVWTVADSDPRLAETQVVQTTQANGITLDAIHQQWAARQAMLGRLKKGRVSTRSASQV